MSFYYLRFFVGSLSIVLISVLLVVLKMSADASTFPPVTSTISDGQIIIDNGLISITVDRRSSNLIALGVYRNGRLMELGKPGQSMYFDSNGGPQSPPADASGPGPKAGYMPLSGYCSSVDLVTDTPVEAEIVAKGGPVQWLPFMTEVHYIVRRGVSGLYAYCVYHHGSGMAAGNVGQTRFVVRGPAGPKVFTDVAVDDARIGPVDQSPQVRTVSDATFLLEDGSVYCKYDNSAFMAHHHIHGMLGHGIGLWMINPSEEYVNGGPIKQELTVHYDNTLLNMLDGGHYGAGGISVENGQEWTKFFGPFLVYANSGPNDAAMYADAKREEKAEERSWPYQWVNNPAYPTERGTVTGKLRLSDHEAIDGAWVVLAAPGGDWPMQANGYEFWSQVDSDGHFTIPKVRPGSYSLYAYGANQFEQFEYDNVTIVPNEITNLGLLNWIPVKHGITLWQIGTPDRTTEKYRGGQDNWGSDGVRHWANFMSYQQNFPNDVDFVIGQSHEATDWNFAQWTWYSKKPYWSIDFTVPVQQKGQATLTFGIAASNPLHGRTHEIIKVNGTQVGELQLAKSGAAAYRSGGCDSLYQIKYLTFPAELLTKGNNEVTLGDTDAMPFPDKDQQMLGKVGAIMFDSIRLEVQPQSSKAY